MKIRKLVLVVIFISLNILVYHITEINTQERIQIALDNSINNLKIHYDILQYHHNITADTIYISTITMIPNFIELFADANTASKEEQNIIREKLYKILKRNII